MALSKIDIENMITGEVNVVNGGTGLSSGTSGQILKFSNSTTLASAAEAAGGKLLQVQNADFTGSNTAVTAASFGATEVTDQITPSATSSKILVMMSLTLGMYENSGTGNHCQAAIYKQVGGGGYSRVSYGNADNSFDGQSGFGSGTEINSSRFVTLQFLDSPNTTSAVDYKLYIRLSVSSGGGDSVNTGPSNLQRSVTLMEIGA